MCGTIRHGGWICCGGFPTAKDSGTTQPGNERSEPMNVLINITYQGQSGNYLVNMDPGVDDATIKNICEEAVRSGEVPGVSPAIPKNAFANFVIDRFHGDQPRFVVRPKVPFGSN
jgi:hypothetical protein